MGIGGVGMCGLAEVLLNEGVEVSGCDLSVSERTRRLEDLGVAVAIGHDPCHLEGVDAVVTSAAVSPAEPELEAAARCGLAVVRRSELLGELMRTRRGIAVAGTHGKTTTTALIGHLMTAARHDPTVIVGGRPAFMNSHARVGSGAWLVCEADEYDRSFLELGPEISVVTNVEPEHLDCYGGVEGLCRAFAAFANRTSVFGAVVVCADDPGSWALRSRLRRRAVWYGTSPEADLRFQILGSDTAGTRFEVLAGPRSLGAVHLPLPGRFNVLNALAAVAVGLEAGLEFDEIAGACAKFRGVARRFELRGERDGVVVIDDYAHHPTELAAVFEAARQAMPGRRIVAVFQPHLYSRTREFAGDFARSLLAADVAVVLPIYPAREQPLDGVSAEMVVSRALELGHPSVVEGPPIDEALAGLKELLRPGDLLLTVGAGDVDRLATAWLEED